jgi:hypothetical protein
LGFGMQKRIALVAIVMIAPRLAAACLLVGFAAAVICSPN